MAPPRLPDQIVSSYRQYKFQSSSVVHWVVTTAAPLLTVPEPIKQSNGSTGGNRKKKKKPNKASTYNPYEPRITLSRFRELAAAIQNAGIVASREILESLQMVIRLRKHTAGFYSSDAEAVQNNKGHMKAIEIYTEVYHLLKGPADVLEEDSKKDWLYAGALEKLSLAMKDLVLEEEKSFEKEAEEEKAKGPGKAGTLENEWLKDNAFLLQQQKKAKEPKQPKAVEYPITAYETVEEENDKTDLADAFIAVVCFFTDLLNIRNYLGGIWSRTQPAGPVSRLTAAMVSNQAVELVKVLEYELRSEFPKLAKTEDIYAMVMDKIQANPDQEVGIKQTFMSEIFEDLELFSKVIHPETTPVAVEGYWGYYDPKGVRSDDPEERDEEDRNVLFNYLPDLVILHRLKNRVKILRDGHKMMGDDGFPYEAGNYIKDANHPVSMSFVFSAQLYLDVLYVRRKQEANDLEAMRQAQRFVCRQMDRYLEKNDIELPSNMDTFLLAVDLRSQFLEYQIGGDVIYEIKKKNKFGEGNQTNGALDYSWSMNPWMCANGILHTAMEFWEVGTALAGGAGFVQCFMHLYNMLQVQGHLPRNASLLPDHLISVFGSQVFRGEPPKTKFTNRFLLMLGQKTEVFAQGGRRPVGGNRRAAHHEGGTGIKAELADSFNLFASTQRTVEIKKLDAKSKKEKALVPSQDALPLVRTLALTKVIFEKDLELMLRIDWFAVHRVFVELFRRLWRDLKLGICAALHSMEDDVLEDESQLGYVAGWLMRIKEEFRHPSADILLKGAAGVIESFEKKLEAKRYMLDV